MDDLFICMYIFKEKSSDNTNETTTSPPMFGAVLDLGAWLSGKVSFADWKRVAGPRSNALIVTTPATTPAPPSDELRDNQLAQKYTNYWREKVNVLKVAFDVLDV